MKLFDIALKDMLRYFRSAFAVGMMFVVPLMITGLLAFAFGGVITSSETAAYTLPVITVQIANLDEGDKAVNASAPSFARWSSPEWWSSMSGPTWACFRCGLPTIFQGQIFTHMNQTRRSSHALRTTCEAAISGCSQKDLV